MIGEHFDFEKEYGIVLEGGGAKGAYQIGVWKALMEYGVKIRAVAGVSVGALNGALICMGDYEKAVSIWKNISYSRIMNIDDAEMDKLINRKFKEVDIQTVRKEGKKVLVSGGIDVTPLRELIEENIDEQKIKASEIEFYMGTFNVSSLKEMDISAKEAEDGYLTDYLMASSNFPLFKNEKLMGKTFLDGGVANNVPIDLLLKRGYKNIIVVRIFGPGIEKKVKIPEDVTLISIEPRVHLCNVLEFDKKKAIRNITLGYYDAVRILKPLSGINYYIEASRSERDYLQTLLNPEEEVILSLDMMNKSSGGFPTSLPRILLEELYPQLATSLKLEKNWSYEELYYALLEYCAKKLRIKRYKIYSEAEFCQILRQRLLDTYADFETMDTITKVTYAILRNNFT